MAAAPDPEQFDRLAARLLRTAQQFDDSASRIVNQTNNLNWVGPGADSFKSGMKDFGGVLNDAAGLMKQVAGGFRDGANSIRNPPKKK